MNGLKLKLSFFKSLCIRKTTCHIKIPLENHGLWWSWGGVHSEPPQNLSLDWPSVWGGKSFTLRGKMEDSRGPGG